MRDIALGYCLVLMAFVGIVMFAYLLEYLDQADAKKADGEATNG